MPSGSAVDLEKQVHQSLVIPRGSEEGETYEPNMAVMQLGLRV
jgi:hypothetical protein